MDTTILANTLQAQHERRWRIVPVEAGILCAVFQHRIWLTFDPPLPEDAAILSVQGNWEGQTIDLLIASRTFDPVPINEIPSRWLHQVIIHPLEAKGDAK